MDTERRRWITTWVRGWRRAIQAEHDTAPGGINHSILPLDVATSMIEELLAEVDKPAKGV
jgi:hypothetical protein